MKGNTRAYRNKTKTILKLLDGWWGKHITPKEIEIEAKIHKSTVAEHLLSAGVLRKAGPFSLIQYEVKYLQNALRNSLQGDARARDLAGVIRNSEALIAEGISYATSSCLLQGVGRVGQKSVNALVKLAGKKIRKSLVASGVDRRGVAYHLEDVIKAAKADAKGEL